MRKPFLYIAILLYFFLPVPYAVAATWYDKLPVNGELSPKVDNGGIQPNYSGNVGPGTETLPVDVSDPEASPSERIAAENALQRNASALQHRQTVPLSGRMFILLLVCVVVVSGGVILLWGNIKHRQQRPRV